MKKRIGILSLGWGPMGHCLVNRNFRDAFSKDFDVYVFATKNYRPGQVLMKTTEGRWNIPNLTFADFGFNECGKNKNKIEEWLDKNKIDVLFVNEMFNWSFVKYFKKKLKVVTYLDYFNESWLEKLKIYDGIIICTKRTFNVFKDYENVYYVPWGIDTDLFKPQEGDKSTFFHSAGWGGYKWRKNTPLVIEAFYELNNQKYKLFLHTQIKQYPQKTAIQIKELIAQNRLKIHVGSVAWPGLYHKGKIHVCPTKLEGLGLFLPEGLSCGLPAITTNAAPMNEFVEDEYNGLLVDSLGEYRRKDYGGSYYFPANKISKKSLKKKMEKLASDTELIEEMSKNARQSILDNYNFEIFREKSVEAIKSIL